jgi:hypothetical protein
MSTAPVVLMPWAVLGKETWPVLGVGGHVDGAVSHPWLDGHSVGRHDEARRCFALGDDPGVDAVQSDLEPEYAAFVSGETAVAEVDAE